MLQREYHTDGHIATERTSDSSLGKSPISADDAALCHSLHNTSKRQEAPPEALKVLPNWGTFRLARAEDGTLDKIPVDGFTSTDSKTHRAYEAAQAALKRKRGDVLGFALPADRSMTGLDFDHCLDAETGDLLAWAAPFLAPFLGHTYIERTPSGTGLRAYVRGMKPGDRCKYPASDGGAIEVYDHDRLFTVTGNRFQDAPATIANLQQELDDLYRALFPARQERPAQRGDPVTLDDQTLLDKAMKDATFAALWRGELAGKPSASEADSALAYRLAWWSDSDEARIERLMRASGRTRDKWDKKDGVFGTWLLRTIHKAILANAGRCYSGAKGDSMPEQDATASDDAPAQETTGATGQNDCCAAKDKIIAQLQRELKKKQARIDELEARERWEKKARRNKDISATTKAVARSAIEFYQQSKPIEGQPNHLRKLWYEKIAAASGVSESTVKTEMDKLSAWGGGEKKTVRVTSEKTGKRVDRVIWAPSSALLERPELLKPEKPRNHGGKRECPGCGSKHLRIKSHHYLTCMECGERWEEETAERILRGDEAEMAARADNMPLDDGFSGEQDATANAETPAEDCPPVSVQIETGQSSPRETATKPGMNHHDERAELLALLGSPPLHWDRIPVGLEGNVGGSEARWRVWTAHADNALIDEALRSLRIRAEGKQAERQVS